MDKRYAIIDTNNIVINVIVWDGVTAFDYGQSHGNYLISLDGVESYGIGWIYDKNSGTFTDPALAINRK